METTLLHASMVELLLVMVDIVVAQTECECKVDAHTTEILHWKMMQKMRKNVIVLKECTVGLLDIYSIV